MNMTSVPDGPLQIVQPEGIAVGVLEREVVGLPAELASRRFQSC